MRTDAESNMSQAPADEVQMLDEEGLIVSDNDVLCGRGNYLQGHYGNERFRTLTSLRHDANYDTYSVDEKKAVALEIMNHIASLEPPGRFMRRPLGKDKLRGTEGPWVELTRKESLKKVCQALRDCHRQDRKAYANGVVAPDDVQRVSEDLAVSSKTLKQQAAEAINNKLREALEAARLPEKDINEQLRRREADPSYVVPGFTLLNDGSYAESSSMPTLRGQDATASTPEGQSLLSLISSFPIDMDAHKRARIHAGYEPPGVEETSAGVAP